MELAIRPTASRDDERLSLEISNEVWPLFAFTIEDVDAFKRSVIAYSDQVAFVDGEPAGSAFVAIQPSRPAVGTVMITVLAGQRRRGVGSGLYRSVSTWCTEQGIDTLEGEAEADDTESIAFAERRGFVPIEQTGRMVLDLTGVEPLPVAPPAGIDIVTWAERPAAARGMYEIASEGYLDIPGNEDDEMVGFDDWLVHDMQGPGDRPEATFVALAGDEVVGYAKLFLTEARPNVAIHDMTAVRRTWRGKGVAGALKRAQIAWAKGNGFDQLTTGNELRNEAIRRLNRRLGYREAPGRVLMRGPLAGGS
jgi:GNAT superfamily N-acetyltransferase